MATKHHNDQSSVFKFTLTAENFTKKIDINKIKQHLSYGIRIVTKIKVRGQKADGEEPKLYDNSEYKKKK